MKANFDASPYVVLIPVCAGVLIAADDQTVVVTILPQIMLDMKVKITELDRASWTITGYLLGYLAAMPLIGRLSDVWGHRRLFVFSMLAFMAGSVAVALTPTLGWLIAARVFQAVGAGALVPISIAIAGDLFPSGRRGLAYGLIGASAEAGGVVGPLWGGLVTAFADWRWVFWINVPLGLAVLVVLLWLLHASPRYPAKVDYLGGALIAAVIVSLTLGLARIDDPGPIMLGYLGASAAALILLVVRERAAADPLLPASMFKGWTFRAANATHLLLGGALIVGMVTIPLVANTAMALTPLEGGLWLVRLTVAMPVGAVVGGLCVPAARLPSPGGGRTGVGRARVLANEWVGHGYRRPASQCPPGHHRPRLRVADRAYRACRNRLGRRRPQGNGRRDGDGDAHGRDDAGAGHADGLGVWAVSGACRWGRPALRATRRDSR